MHPTNQLGVVSGAAVFFSLLVLGKSCSTVTTSTAVAFSSVPSSVPSASGMPGNGTDAPGGASGDSSSADSGSSAYVLTDGEVLEGGTYSSTNADENAVRANGTTSASMVDVIVEKLSGDSSSSDDSSFYGNNAAVLAMDTAVLNITGGTVTATAEGSNGVFSYDEAVVYISGTEVYVTGGNAGGIEAAGGGTMYAYDLNVTSVVKAAIRSDRGGGIMEVVGGTYTTTGSEGAPAIYSTANITASSATLIAQGCEAVVIEGLNSATIIDCDVTGHMTGTYSASQTGKGNVHNVMLYQSMSGDAEEGTSSFTMSGGSLVSENGDMFYITNTDAIINLSGVDLTMADGTYFLKVSGNDGSQGWGTEGSNGGQCTMNLSGQTASGDISIDDISTLALTIADASTFAGAINSDGTDASALEVTIDGTSTWTLTADCYVTSFSGSMDNVEAGEYTLYVNGTAAN